MLDQATLAPSLLQAITFTLLLVSGVKPGWMLKSGGAWRHIPLLPLTTRLGPLSVILYRQAVLAPPGDLLKHQPSGQSAVDQHFKHKISFLLLTKIISEWTIISLTVRDLLNVSHPAMPLSILKLYRWSCSERQRRLWVEVLKMFTLKQYFLNPLWHFRLLWGPYLCENWNLKSLFNFSREIYFLYASNVRTETSRKISKK